MTGLQAHIRDDLGRWYAVVTFADADNRLRVKDVALHGIGDQTIDARTWRTFPVARVETKANDLDMKMLLREYERAETNEILRTIPAGRPRRIPLRLPPRPAHGRYPDDFYAHVARAYRLCLEWGDPPAQRIADENDVPARTVHGWFVEARRRGLLEPAGRQGRAG
jgi:hypothetical protein